MSKTIKHYRVEITDGKGIIKDCDGYCVSDVPVVAESETELVVQNQKYKHFVIIKKKDKYDHNTRLNIESISINTADSVWGNRVSYSLYTDKTKRPSSIRAAIELEINRKFGFFIGGIDLSCIK